MDSQKYPLEQTAETENQQQSSNVARDPSKDRKVIWTNSSESESYRTVVVNYQILSNGRKSIGALPKRRETWAKMVASMNIHKALKADSDSVIHSIRCIACNNQSNTSSKIYEASLCKELTPSPMCQRQCHGNRHSKKLVTMPPIQSEEHHILPLTISSSSSKIALTRESNTDAHPIPINDENKCGITHKIEILDLPLLQEAKSEDAPERRIGIFPDKADTIVISGDDELRKFNINQVPTLDKGEDILKEPRIANVLKKSVKKNFYCLCNNCSKVAQKFKCWHETSTQTENASVVQKLLQIPPSSSSALSNSDLQISTTYSTRKQRQLELHRLRVQVETNRLELMKMKLIRERGRKTHEQNISERSL